MAFGKKAFNGITAGTPKNLQLDAGAFFIGFEVGKDTYASAKKAGKCLGATQGGGTFTAKPTIRTVDVDGAVGRRPAGRSFQNGSEHGWCARAHRRRYCGRTVV